MPRRGRPPSQKSFTAALRIAAALTEKDGVPRLRRIAEQLVRQAMSGDLAAIKEVADRLDGKPVQQNLNDHYEMKLPFSTSS